MEEKGDGKFDSIVECPCTPLLHPFCACTFSSLVVSVNRVTDEQVTIARASEIAREVMLLFERTGNNMTMNVQELLREHLKGSLEKEKIDDLGVIGCNVLWRMFEMAGDCHEMSKEFMTTKYTEYEDQFHKNIRFEDIKANYSDVMSGSVLQNSKDEMARKVHYARNYIQAASRNADVGVYLMLGLQSLRESPMPELIKLKESWVRVYCSVQKEHLCDLVKRLNVPGAKESVEWLHLNSFMDGSLGCFQAWLRMRVLSEFYASQRTWCQGSANLSYALLTGLKQFRSARSKMNGFSRSFKKDPKRQSMTTSRNMEALKNLLLFQTKPLSNRAVYIEFDAWCHEQDEESHKKKKNGSSKTTKGPEWKSTGGHVFVIHANPKRDRFAIYSSWRKSYSLSEWLNVQDHNRTVFNRVEFVSWMNTFEGLFHHTSWAQNCGYSLDRLFNCVKNEENIIDMKKDVDEEEEDDDDKSAVKEEKTPGDGWNHVMSESAKRIARRRTSDTFLPSILKKKKSGRRRGKAGKDGDVIWELSFAHCPFDVRNLDRNYRDIVRTARRAHKEAMDYVETMATESMDEVSDMQQDALNEDHPFGVRCSYSDLVGALYQIPDVVDVKV